MYYTGLYRESGNIQIYKPLSDARTCVCVKKAKKKENFFPFKKREKSPAEWVGI